MNILYITKLRDSEACGVTNAVLQLLDAIRDCATVSWLDISGNTFTIEKNIRRININDINDIELDVAVFEDPFNSLTFCKIASILSKRNIPYIICPHGSFHRVALKHHAVKKYVAINTVFRVFLKNCLACQFLTSNESLQSLKFNKSIIIPNGINNTTYRIRNKCTNVVFVGRKDVKTKGIDLLIQACALSKDLLRKENITLTIYGSHETIKDDEYIRNAISSNDLQDIVIEKGPVFGLEKEKVLLKRSWSFWENYDSKDKKEKKDYSKLLKEIYTFNDIISFWQFWNKYPGSNTKNIFFNGENIKYFFKEKLRIIAMNLFESGIRPEWEDSKNKKGKVLTQEYLIETGLEQFLTEITEIWIKLICYLIGEIIPHCNNINGIRFVDKAKFGYYKSTIFRIEIWVNSQMNVQDVEELKKYLFDNFKFPGITVKELE